MAQRLSLRYCPPILAALFLLLAAQLGAAQSPGLPAQPPGTAPKPAEPAPAAKELSALEVDGLIEMVLAPVPKRVEPPAPIKLVPSNLVAEPPSARVIVDTAPKAIEPPPITDMAT